jgi:acetyltransferase-like isoleucine patch superfamily enzyme
MGRNYLVQQSLFIFRFRYLKRCLNIIEKTSLRISGMKIGEGTYLSKIVITWPHQVSIGNDCKLEHSIYFKYAGIWSIGPSIIIEDKVFIGSGCEFNITKGIQIGKNTMIASGCRFIDHDHGTAKGTAINDQKATVRPIIIEEEVWLGVNCVVLKGVKIGKGAVVAAGSVVTKSIPAYEIWAGVPAKKINERV